MRPKRASFLPEQRRGSQWLKSWSEVVPWTSVRVVCTYPHRHGNLYPNLWNPVYQSVSDKPKWAKARGVPESDDDISISSLDSSVTPSTSSTALSGRSSNDGDEMVVDKSLKRPLLDVPRPLPRPRLWEDPPRPEEFFLPMGWSESCYWISPWERICLGGSAHFCLHNRCHVCYPRALLKSFTETIDSQEG